MSWRGVARDSTTTAHIHSGPSETQTNSTTTTGVAHPIDAYSSPNAPQHRVNPPSQALSEAQNPASDTPSQSMQTSGMSGPAASPFMHLPPPPPNTEPRQSYVSAAPNTAYPAPFPGQPVGPNGMYNGYAYQAGPYGATVGHEGGKIVGGSKTGVSIRYGLMVSIMHICPSYEGSY